MKTMVLILGCCLGFAMGAQAQENLETKKKESPEVDSQVVGQLASPKIFAPPLYVVDGKKCNDAEFRAVNAYEIESIVVLKDASAVLKYGEEASQGVIVVTTKAEAEKAKKQLSKG